jgi:hypothetical protein
MPPKSMWKIVEFLKIGCEEWGELQVDEASLHRHVGEMLELEREPPELAPEETVEQQVELISSIQWTVTVGNEITPPMCGGSPMQIQTAAKWAWVLFHDFFGEYPPDGDEEGYMALVQKILQMRRPHILEGLPPVS